jgi:hypothetical protein
MDICIVYCYQIQSCMFVQYDRTRNICCYSYVCMYVCRNAGSGVSFDVAIFTQLLVQKSCSLTRLIWNTLYSVMGWIPLAKDRYQWRGNVNTGMILRVCRRGLVCVVLPSSSEEGP